MKRYNLLAVIALAVSAVSCVKNNTADFVAPSAPNGTFSGQFRLLHRPYNGGSVDTAKKANLQLMMSSNGYTYQILGDTTIHAGSHGTYAYDGTFIQFNDATYSATSTPGNYKTTKPHLVGTYQYLFTSNVFQALRTVGDTLSYQYDLKGQ